MFIYNIYLFYNDLFNKKKYDISLYKLTLNIKKHTGKNHYGHLILYTKSTRVTHKYKYIDFKRTFYNIPGIIYKIEYDSYRSALISIIWYKNNIFNYILHIKNININDILYTYNVNFFFKLNTNFYLQIGNKYPLLILNIGTIINNLENIYNLGSKYLRSAGVYGLLLNKFNFFKRALIRLKSGKKIIVSLFIYAIIGMISNENYYLLQIKNAGINKHLGKKSKVRGVAMNPIDHPHGGGEGKKGQPVSPRTKWNKQMKWIITGKHWNPKQYVFMNKYNYLNLYNF